MKLKNEIRRGGKMLLAVLFLVALLLTFARPAAAQALPIYSAQSLSLTNIPAGSTATSTLTLDVRKMANVCIEVTTTSTNLSLQFNSSVSGVKFQPNYKTIVFGAGTTTTNFSVAGLGYLSCTNQINTGSIIATNTIYYSLKIGAP